MRRKLFSAALILMDAAIVTLVPFVALLIRFEGFLDNHYLQMIVENLPITIVICLASFYAFGLYNRLWRYASINELLAIIGAVTASSLIIITYLYWIETDLPRSIYALCWFLLIMLVGCSRLFVRVLYHFRHINTQGHYERVLIIGAGDAGAMIAREIQQHFHDKKKIVGFIDDDPYKKDKYLFGAKVLGPRADLCEVVQQHGVDEIIFAIPSLGGAQMREIVRECKSAGCTMKTVPGIYELLDGKVTVNQLRDIQVEDLLRRDPVKLDLDQIAAYIAGKRVLVTGAGGSIGSELCRQIAKQNPHQLVLLGRGENSIYEIDRELREKQYKFTIEPVIADIKDRDNLNRLFDQFKPQVVFHVAAHKHVPLMEKQPIEAVRNNIFGTKNVAEAADRVRSEIFIMISTDKAVNPTSVMGATKRVAEMVIQNLNHLSYTKFAAVRFGNVLGSRGSVIPLFRRQIAQGGPVTVTHPEMKRYFMTIPEAVQLVLQAGSMTNGGEVFVLEMGEPVKIVDMARDLIELSGLVPNLDIKIEYTGIRLGEKLFEELLTDEEGMHATRHDKISVANSKMIDEKQLQWGIVALQQAINGGDVVGIMKKIVPKYSTESRAKEKLSIDKEQAESQFDNYAVKYQNISGLTST